MDIKLQKKPWLVRHKYYVIGGVLFAALAVYTLVLQCSPARQRVSAGSLGIAEAAEADFLEYVEQEGSWRRVRGWSRATPSCCCPTPN